MTDRRQQDIRLIHVAARELRLSRDDYEAVLLAVCGVRSSADLDGAGRAKLLAHFKKLGFTVKPKKPSRALANDAQSRKIRALWLSLADAGVVRNRSEAALASYAKRQCGVDALQWLTASQAQALIESLKRWLTRTTESGGTT